MNRKAVSFSANFIVVVILVIVALGLFFILFSKFMGQSESAKAELDKRYINEIQRLIAEGGKVAVYPQNIEIQPGKSGAVGVGIMNNAGSDKEFKIIAECNATINLSKIIKNCPADAVSFAKQNVVLKNNEQKIMPIVISMKKEIARGTYIINIEVRTADNAGYDGLTHKVYVQV
jgi:hypothetical protein